MFEGAAEYVGSNSPNDAPAERHGGDRLMVWLNITRSLFEMLHTNWIASRPLELAEDSFRPFIPGYDEGNLLLEVPDSLKRAFLLFIALRCRSRDPREDLIAITSKAASGSVTFQAGASSEAIADRTTNPKASKKPKQSTAKNGGRNQSSRRQRTVDFLPLGTVLPRALRSGMTLSQHKGGEG